MLAIGPLRLLRFAAGRFRRAAPGGVARRGGLGGADAPASAEHQRQADRKCDEPPRNRHHPSGLYPSGRKVAQETGRRRPIKRAWLRAVTGTRRSPGLVAPPPRPPATGFARWACWGCGSTGPPAPRRASDVPCGSSTGTSAIAVGRFWKRWTATTPSTVAGARRWPRPVIRPSTARWTRRTARRGELPGAAPANGARSEIHRSGGTIALI